MCVYPAHTLYMHVHMCVLHVACMYVHTDLRTYARTWCGVQHDPFDAGVAIAETPHETSDVVQHIVLHQHALIQVLHHLMDHMIWDHMMGVT